MLNLMNPLTYLDTSHGTDDRLSTLSEFGSNPGALRALTYIPKDLPVGAPLVIVLHGSKQSAEEYDHGSGWSELADRYGFALLFPEQQRHNNWVLSFNWFQPRDSRRGSGETLSIRQMIEQVSGDLGIDRKRIFITGLSSGGAMTSVMLATYPEVFAGGAIIAGLPYGCASNVPAAFRRMRGRGAATGRQLVARVRNASKHTGPWPTISIWHGSRDRTVDASNVEAIIRQWRTLLKLGRLPSRIHLVDGYPRRAWSDSKGRELLEVYSITGMGHGTPLKTYGRNSYGASGDYMLDVNISSTSRIADFWGLKSSKRTVCSATRAA